MPITEAYTEKKNLKKGTGGNIGAVLARGDLSVEPVQQAQNVVFILYSSSKHQSYQKSIASKFEIFLELK
jgi:hypothetical protein